jgi:hypothetical protein
LSTIDISKNENRLGKTSANPVSKFVVSLSFAYQDNRKFQFKQLALEKSRT